MTGPAATERKAASEPVLTEEEAIERIRQVFDAEDVQEEKPVEASDAIRDRDRDREEYLADMPQPNMNKMMKQVQAMQAEMMKAQEQLKEEVVEASAGGGMVTVKISGDLELKEIKIDPSALGDDPSAGVDADDVEMLQDMVLAAVNEAIRSAQELANRKLGGVAGMGGLGDLGLPGL